MEEPVHAVVDHLLYAWMPRVVPWPHRRVVIKLRHRVAVLDSLEGRHVPSARVHLAVTYTQDQVAGLRGVGDVVEACGKRGIELDDVAEEKREGDAHL